MSEDSTPGALGRRRLRTADAATFRPHDHVAWCGEGSAGLVALAATAFAAALERGELLLLVSEFGDPAVLAAPGPLVGVEELVEKGTLRCQSIAGAYEAGGASTVDRRSGFLRIAEDALDQGYSGLCVVADNTPFVSGTEEQFREWLAWEAVADEMQSEAPINGICYFDRQRVTAERLADLVTLHPVVSDAFGEPEFQMYFDGGALRVLGSLDTLSVDKLTRVLASAPTLAGHQLDLSGVDFVNHRGLLALSCLAGEGSRLLVRGAPGVAVRVWEMLGSPEWLEFAA